MLQKRESPTQIRRVGMSVVINLGCGPFYDIEHDSHSIFIFYFYF